MKKEILKECIRVSIFFTIGMIIFLVCMLVASCFNWKEEAGIVDSSLFNSNDIILVNKWNELPDGYKVVLKDIGNGHSVNEVCYSDLMNMIDDCKAEGLVPVICSSYRSKEKQEELFNNKVNQLIARGYSIEEAQEEAGKTVAVPGTSEHQLGLAVDIVDINNQRLDNSQEMTNVQQWLIKNSWKYGFILRYPNDKSDITGIIYEPWHYRYVGRNIAEVIYRQKVCLEEYVNRVK